MLNELCCIICALLNMGTSHGLFQFDMVDIFSSGAEVDQCLLNYPPFRCHLRVTVQIWAYFSHSLLFSIFLLMFEFIQQS